MERGLSFIYPGAVVNLGTRMLGTWLAVQDVLGHYQGQAHVLLYKGHMLAYDPVNNGVDWIQMRGMSSSLTAAELWSADDISNFYLCPPQAPVPKPTQPLPADLSAVVFVPTGAESDLGSDLFAKWDTEERQDWSHVPTPLATLS